MTNHKTKAGALKAARKDLGAEAIEGVDFNLHNTGAGWEVLPIPAGNIPAAEARRARREARARRDAGLPPVKAAGRKRMQQPEVLTKGDSIVAGQHRAVAAASQGRPVVCKDLESGETALKMAVPKAKPGRKPKAKPAPPQKRPKRADVLAAAERGELPEAPDFSAEHHKRWRAKLDEVRAMVQAGDIHGLETLGIEPKSSSRAAICRYAHLAVVALKARAQPVL